VKGPVGQSVTGLSELLKTSIIQSTADVSDGLDTGSGNSTPPKPLAPNALSPILEGDFQGLDEPGYTETPVSGLKSMARQAFFVATSSGMFPKQVVIPNKLSLSDLSSATILATRSSPP